MQNFVPQNLLRMFMKAQADNTQMREEKPGYIPKKIIPKAKPYVPAKANQQQQQQQQPQPAADGLMRLESVSGMWDKSFSNNKHPLASSDSAIKQPPTVSVNENHEEVLIGPCFFISTHVCTTQT